MLCCDVFLFWNIIFTRPQKHTFFCIYIACIPNLCATAVFKFNLPIFFIKSNFLTLFAPRSLFIGSYFFQEIELKEKKFQRDCLERITGKCTRTVILTLLPTYLFLPPHVWPRSRVRSPKFGKHKKYVRKMNIARKIWRFEHLKIYKNRKIRENQRVVIQNL